MPAISPAIDLAVTLSIVKKLTTPFNKTEAYQRGIIDATGCVLRPKHTLTTEADRKAYTYLDTLVFNLKRILEKLPFGKSQLASYAAALYLLREPRCASMNESQLMESFSRFAHKFKTLQESTQLRRAHVLKEASGDVDPEARFQATVARIRADKEMSPEGKRTAYKDALKQRAKDLRAYEKAKLTEEQHRKVAEDAPANAAGGGGIAGIGVGPQGEPGVNLKKRKKFAGHTVFEVDPKRFHEARMGKRRYTRYESIVGNDELGEEIRSFARANPHEAVVLQNNQTGAMQYLRYGRKNPARGLSHWGF